MYFSGARIFFFFFFLTERRNAISKQDEKQGNYLLYICALQDMDCGRGQSNLCELQGKLRTMGKRAHESGAAKEGFMEEVMPEVTTDG